VPGHRAESALRFAELWRRHSILYVLAGSFLLWAGGWGLYMLLTTDKPATFDTFMTKYGAAIGILYTIVLGVLVARIPNRLEEEVTNFSERIQSPLRTFEDVFHRSLGLLESIEDDNKSSFRMVAASPVFGIEMREELRDKWRRALERRIVSGLTTEVVCLDSRVTGDQYNSPLFRFCAALAEYYLKDTTRLQALFRTASKDVEDFQQLARVRDKSFSLRLGQEPPFQLIVVQDGGGKRTAVFYFASTGTLKDNLPVTGIVTQDDRMTTVMEHLFEYSRKAAEADIVDPRTEPQRQRDDELLEFLTAKTRPYEVTLDSIAPGFSLVVHEGVFPVDLSLGGETLVDGVDKAVEETWKRTNVPLERRIGVDVGTGTGVLALALAKECSRVIGIDVDDKAVRNARENVERFKKATGSACRFEIARGSLLESIKIPPDAVPLIVFNQPFYPSPHTVVGTGGEKAGLAIIRPFLEAAQPIVSGRGAVVMPYSEVAAEHNPLTVAVELGYVARLLCHSEHPKFGHLYVYLFTQA
jgi:predicted RNA methylase